MEGAHRNADVPRPDADSYALLYDPAGWLQLDPRSGTVRTQRELRDPSAFLQGGWYIALLLARDDGDRPLTHPPAPRPRSLPPHLWALPLTVLSASPSPSRPASLGHGHAVH